MLLQGVGNELDTGTEWQTLSCDDADDWVKELLWLLLGPGCESD